VRLNGGIDILERRFRFAAHEELKPTASGVVVMPLLGRAKQRIGSRIGSSATASEGKQNLLCAYLAAALLVGLLGKALIGVWWLDPLVGLFIAAVAVQEGREAWRGEACCDH
jgi:divalent metal cation (Fe/Co/Zn/Cd) transporter